MNERCPIDYLFCAIFLPFPSQCSFFHPTLSSCLFLQVYNEEIRDLLVEGGGDEKLEVRQGADGIYFCTLILILTSFYQNLPIFNVTVTIL